MYNEYYILRGLVLSENKILTDGDKERLLKYLDVIKEDDLILSHNQSKGEN